MGKPKRSPGATTATARAQSATVERAAQDWWNNGVREPPAELPPPREQEQAEWPPEEEGDWFFIEMIREFPFLTGMAIRYLLRLNRRYWVHVWCFVAGWWGSTYALDALNAHTEKTGFAAVALKFAICGLVHVISEALLFPRVPLSAPAINGMLIRILYDTIGGLYTFVFLGVTQTPFYSTFGKDCPAEGEALEKAFTPIFIIALIFVKHLYQLGWQILGIYEPGHANPECHWLPMLTSNC